MVENEMPMTPRQALVIASLVCEFEIETTTASAWRAELREVLAELNTLAQALGGK